ncbi:MULTISPECIES: hypothetical protein [Auritidibacter]|uniref:hypothetical protein n=1 Tax=Auritidibacter TaxID=1160973 RepID=UPI00131477EB|nr:MULTISPECIES: hypothetical protein [Auritidibacter]
MAYGRAGGSIWLRGLGVFKHGEPFAEISAIAPEVPARIDHAALTTRNALY